MVELHSIIKIQFFYSIKLKKLIFVPYLRIDFITYKMSFTLNEIPDELKCPITYDYLDDPIIMSCCGKAISREQMKMLVVKKCPMCNADKSGEDFDVIPKSTNLAYLVELHKSGKLTVSGRKNYIKLYQTISNSINL